MILLNLGSGGKKLPGYVNVDSNSEENPDVVCDLGTETWPWEDSSVDGAVCSHVLEHLPGGCFFHFLRELYRVCRAEAVVELYLPHPRHDIFLNDPTHCRAVTVGTMCMFSKEHWTTMRAKGIHLTPFWKYNKVDFYLDPDIKYSLDPSVSPDDPELGVKMQHLNNIVMEWKGRMTVRK